MRAVRFLPSRRWLIGGLVVITLAGILFGMMRTEFDWQSIPRAMAKLNTAVVLSLTAVLPLAGFPISMVYLLVGARFGRVLGLIIVSGITAVHLLGTHWIARSFLRRPLLLFIERRRHRIPVVPPGENGAIALMVMLAPAVPYFVRNYLLALSGVPVRVYFWMALPIHVGRSYVALFLGNFGSSPSPNGLVFLGIFYATKLTIFGWVAWWLRARHKRLAAARANHGASML